VVSSFAFFTLSETDNRLKSACDWFQCFCESLPINWSIKSYIISAFKCQYRLFKRNRLQQTDGAWFYLPGVVSTATSLEVSFYLLAVALLQLDTKCACVYFLNFPAHWFLVTTYLTRAQEASCCISAELPFILKLSSVLCKCHKVITATFFHSHPDINIIDNYLTKNCAVERVSISNTFTHITVYPQKTE
jgi:hypothetical protein